MMYGSGVFLFIFLLAEAPAGKATDVGIHCCFQRNALVCEISPGCQLVLICGVGVIRERLDLGKYFGWQSFVVFRNHRYFGGAFRASETSAAGFS